VPVPFPRRGLAAALVLGVLTVATPASADWPQFHAGPARLGFSRDRSISPRNAGRLKVLWSHATRKSAEGVNSSPAVTGGTVYVGSDDGRLWAFGARGGGVRWSHATGGPVKSSPAVAKGRVFVGSESGAMFAFGTERGHIKWKRRLRGRITASPLVAKGRVFIGSRGGAFYALDARTGRIRWKRHTWSVWDGAAYRHGTVYVGSDRARVYALNARTGGLRWVREVRGRVRGTPAVTDRRVYVGTDKGRLIALDRRTGAKRWGAQAVKPGAGMVRCAPAVAGGRVYISVAVVTPMDGKVNAYSARTGRLEWRAKLADYATSSPAVANGVVFVGSFDHRLYALAADTGREIWTSGWQYEGGFFDRGISSSPAIAGGRIFVGVRDGHVYALGLRR
jgi:outer membrane protein assembly factor BamB